MSEHFEEDGLLRTAREGIQAEQFLATPMGKKMWARADAKVSDALAALATADPEDSKTIRELQNEAKLGAMFKTWIEDIIMEGKQAELEIEREEATDGIDHPAEGIEHFPV